jgi:inner membrane transporter RhtA
MRATERIDAVPATALVMASILSVQFGGAVARTVFDELGAAGVALLRLAIAALVLLVVGRPDLRTWTRTAWVWVGLLGVTLAGMNMLFYLALRTVPIGIAVTVEFTGPLLLALVQTRRWLDGLWVLLAGAGVVLLGALPGGDVALSGLALAFVAGLFWAGYIQASARVGRELPGTDGLGAAFVIAAVLVAPFGLAGAEGVVGDPGLLLIVTGVALLSSVLPYGLEMGALRRIPTRVFGVLMSMEPAAAALAGLVVLGQGLSLRGAIALVLVSVASLGITLGGRSVHT